MNELSLYDTNANPGKSSLLDQYSKPGTLLDIGCGNGLYGLHCADKKSFEVTQLDICDRRNPAAKHLPFIKANAETYSLPDNFFDNVIALDIIEHLDHDQVILEKLYCSMKPGGRLFISVPNEDNSPLEPLQLAHIHYTDKTHRREYSHKFLAGIIESTGFCIIETKPQINRSLTNFPKVLSRGHVISRVIATFCTLQIKMLLKLGLLHNPVTADWLLVGEKPETS